MEKAITAISNSTLHSLESVQNKRKFQFNRVDVGAYIKMSLGLGSLIKGSAEPYFKLFFKKINFKNKDINNEYKILTALLFIFSFSNNSYSKEGYLSNYWFNDSEEKSFQEDNLKSVDGFMKDYASSLDNLNMGQEKSFGPKNWSFQAFKHL